VPFWKCFGGYGCARNRASDVDGAPMGDRHQPRFDVGIRVETWVGPHGGQKRLRPGIFGIDRPEHRAADAQHRRAVLGYHVLERSHIHIL
jgi:hypothetical protein